MPILQAIFRFSLTASLDDKLLRFETNLANIFKSHIWHLSLAGCCEYLLMLLLALN